ncbi:MAG: reverse transcriptase/maturase family protein [Candidatus Woesearchaeota archaeon]
MGVNDNNNRFNINANDNINNNRPVRGMASSFCRDIFQHEVDGLKTYRNLWQNIYNFENLEQGYWRAKKHKSNNPKVIEFEKHWRLNLCILLRELRTKTYNPLPLKKFVLRDPKTRLICVSDFRDRIVHHALINVLQPIFEPRFIFDSHASRKGKGTVTALKRFDQFKRKVTVNGKLLSRHKNANDVIGYALKADVRHYFQTVDHKVLLDIISKRVKDGQVMWLIKLILENYESDVHGKGMPLGNWTSQFFANIYLNELDQFAKHRIKAKHYVRYVDDFVILHRSRTALQEYEQRIERFLSDVLKLELHPDKCQIVPLNRGISLLGFRVFYHHKLVRKRNLIKIQTKLSDALEGYRNKSIEAWEVLETLQGWSAYAMQGNTYNLRNKLCCELENKLKSVQMSARKIQLDN